LNFK